MVQLLLAVIYMAFVSLGLPDGLLGAAWPVAHLELGVPVSYAGMVYGVISVSTILSSLSCDFLTKKLGAGKVTAFSVAITAGALLGFSVCDSYWQILLMAVPYGLGAGSVDASLNTYVALNCESRHMSWLQCMWGIGATSGPYIMSACLTRGLSWSMGYRSVGLIQVALTGILFLSLPLWKSAKGAQPVEKGETVERLSHRQLLAIPGVKNSMLLFFVYCALEQTAMLWASSYLVMHYGMAEDLAAAYGGLTFVGVTLGRFLGGFLTFKFNNRQMIRLGQSFMALGILVMLLPVGEGASLVGLFLLGIGCSPIYPCLMHSTPIYFGAERAQSIVGMQTASFYVGNICLPTLFGVIANHISASLMPWYLLLFLVLLVLLHERMCKYKTALE